VKARFEFTCDIDVERYAECAGIACERVRWDASAYISSSIPDFAGLVNTEADRRYHRSARTRPGAIARVQRRGRLKLRIGLTVAVERGRYAAWASVRPGDARDDLLAYITRSVEDLPILAEAKVPVRWHRPTALRSRRTEWPIAREDEQHHEPAPAPAEETWWE